MAQPLTFDERMAAIETAIGMHHSYLENYLAGLTRNRADAEDLCSELWIEVLHRFNDEHIACFPILRRKAYQLFIDYYRRKLRSKEELTDAISEEATSLLGREAYTTTEEEALKARFWAEFPVHLEPLQKEALWMTARYGFTIKEISERLEQPPSTIGDWITKARNSFTQYFNEL